MKCDINWELDDQNLLCAIGKRTRRSTNKEGPGNTNKVNSTSSWVLLAQLAKLKAEIYHTAEVKDKLRMQWVDFKQHSLKNTQVIHEIKTLLEWTWRFSYQAKWRKKSTKEDEVEIQKTVN